MEAVADFWDYVDKCEDDGCWLWTGHLHSQGYGVMRVEGKPFLTHRYSYQLHYGPIPKGMSVLHDCDRNYPVVDITYRRCIRPEHLFLGTVIDNNADMRQKKRHAYGLRSGVYTHPEMRNYGEKSHTAKLTAEEVIAIRQAYASGSVTITSLARQYGISVSSASALVRGKTWKHLPKPETIWDGLTSSERASKAAKLEQPKVVVCPTCGGNAVGFRKITFCSNLCRSRAMEARRKERRRNSSKSA